MEQPAIRMIVENDIYKLNTYADAQYGIMAFTQGQHSSSTDSDFTKYGLTLFYVDRLIEDGRNQVEIQSTGVEVLENILQKLSDLGLIVDDGFTFQPFNEKFTDQCAGVFTNVNISVLKNAICPEGYADFNEDFNEDFLII